MTSKFSALVALLSITAAAASAVETKKWVVSQARDYDDAELHNIAVSSTGRLSLAPAAKVLIDSGTAQFWAVTADARGNVYAGGADGKVHVWRNGAASVLAALDGGTVFALTLDADGNVIAGVSPSGRIHRISASGRVSLVAETKASYIWALAHDKAGTLFAGTGEPGQIISISPSGQSRVVIDAGEAHVRSLALDTAGNWLAGTEPGGSVLRVNPRGEPFLILQTAKREVTSIAAGPRGVIYAAASGARSTPTAPAAPIVTPRPATPAASPQQATAQPQPAQAQPAQTQPAAIPAAIPGAMAATGGSEIYQIEADGEPRLLWASAREIVYSLAVDSKGMLYAATGNEGRVYRIDSAAEATRIADLQPPQATALASGPSGALLVATANPGQIQQLGPGVAAEATVESAVFDAKAFTYWGRLSAALQMDGGSIAFETRSGNGERTQKFWSPWSAPVNGRVVSPPARFLAWRAILKAAPGGASPVLSLAEIAYQQKNTAPEVGPIEMTPPGYKFSSSASILTPSATLTLPAIGQRAKDDPPSPNTAPAGTAAMTYEKGMQSARWKASDANGDTLLYSVEIRGEDEKLWKPLKTEVKENRISFDTVPWPDGRYSLKVTVTDKEDNYPGEGLSAEAEGEPFIIDNTPPSIDSLTAGVQGAKLIVRLSATDALSALQSAEMSINGGAWIAVKPSTRMTDSLGHEYLAETAKPASDEFTVAVRVYDERDNVAVRKTVIRP